MAIHAVRLSEAYEIAYGKRSGPRQGKVLRDALVEVEECIKASRKRLRKDLDADATPEPKMPSREEAARRMAESLEREYREHPERFLDEAEFAALEERLRPAPMSPERPMPSHAELAALISEVRYELRGQEIDAINAGRKVAKVKKQTAKRVREHRARKAAKQSSGDP